jgi:hypothetical protein
VPLEGQLEHSGEQTAKHTVTGSRIAASTKNLIVPAATRLSTKPYDIAMTIGMCVRYRL